MRHRKLKADFLFTGEKLLTNEKILITDLNGEIIDIIDKKDAGEEIETFKGILSPGFVNAHCHLELSHLKNKIPERTGLVDFVLFFEKELMNYYKYLLQQQFHFGTFLFPLLQWQQEFHLRQNIFLILF